MRPAATEPRKPAGCTSMRHADRPSSSHQASMSWAATRMVTRARLSEITLQRLFKRRRISPELLAEVQEWLFRVGWVLFFAGTTYAVIKIKAIDGWGLNFIKTDPSGSRESRQRPIRLRSHWKIYS